MGYNLFQEIKSIDHLSDHTFWSLSINGVHYAGDFHSSHECPSVSINQEFASLVGDTIFAETDSVWYIYASHKRNRVSFKKYENKKQFALRKLKLSNEYISEDKLFNFIKPIQAILTPYDVYDFIEDTWPPMDSDEVAFLTNLILHRVNLLSF